MIFALLLFSVFSSSLTSGEVFPDSTLHSKEWIAGYEAAGKANNIVPFATGLGVCYLSPLVLKRISVVAQDTNRDMRVGLGVTSGLLCIVGGSFIVPKTKIPPKLIEKYDSEQRIEFEKGYIKHADIRKKGAYGFGIATGGFTFLIGITLAMKDIGSWD